MSRVATEGKYLYIQHCRTCHGEGGLGNTALAMKVQLRALGSREVQAQSDAEMKQTILLGKGQMRGATRLFSSNEADRLVAYLRTLSSVNEQSAPAQLSLQQQGTTPPPPIAGKSKPPKTLLVGNWANQNPNTPSITRLYIHYVPTGGTEVHAWGRCGGGECDWGEAPASPAPAALSVLWDQHFAVRRWLLSFDGQTRLLTLSEHTHYQDNSGRPDKDETSVFVRTGY
jgi:cytochrome c553